MESTRELRLAQANQVIRICARYGRHFFEYKDRVSRFEFSRGRLWYIDKYTERRIFVHYEPAWRAGKWRGFSEGGTLHSLIEHLRDYILGKVPEINMKYFGPWPEWVCNGDLWGYGDSMAVVRSDISALLSSHAEMSMVGRDPVCRSHENQVFSKSGQEEMER